MAWLNITEITTALHLTTKAIRPDLVFFLEYISTYTMRASGVMNLLLGGLEYYIIKMLGCCHYNEMMMNFHKYNCPIIQYFVGIVVNHGNYD